MAPIRLAVSTYPFYYSIAMLAIAIGFFCLSFPFHPQAVFTIWAGISFALLAMAYFVNRAEMLGKHRDGRRHWIFDLLLAPYAIMSYLLIGLQRLVLRRPKWHQINPHLAISGILHPTEFPSDVAFVVDLTAEFLDSSRETHPYRALPMLDGLGISPQKLMTNAAEIPIPESGCVLVHCANGNGRSAMFASLWLVVHGFAQDGRTAFDMIHSQRPSVRLNRFQKKLLDEAVGLFENAGAR